MHGNIGLVLVHIIYIIDMKNPMQVLVIRGL